MEDDCWKNILEVQVPQCIHTFLWLVRHKAILTNHLRMCRHLINDPTYDIYHSEMEDWIHVLRDCGEAKAVWQELVPDTYKAHFF